MEKFGKTIKKSVGSLESSLKKILKNDNLRNILLVLLIVYCVFFINKTPANIRNFLKSLPGKIIILLLVVYFAYNDITIAILLIITYIMLHNTVENMQGNNAELSVQDKVKNFFNNLWSNVKSIFGVENEVENTVTAEVENAEAENAEVENAEVENAEVENVVSENSEVENSEVPIASNSSEHNHGSFTQQEHTHEAFTMGAGNDANGGPADETNINCNSVDGNCPNSEKVTGHTTGLFAEF